MNQKQIYKKLGLKKEHISGGNLEVFTPIDGTKIATVQKDVPQSADKKIAQSVTAFKSWRNIPAPRRGELVRIFGEILRENKEALGALVTLECGKIYQEGLGEVQEMIDICDFAVGLSRQLYGLTIASERPQHKMREIWQPIGPVGIISAFNFPVAVWSWNATLALVCGDSIIWKPSEKTPITALACQILFEQAVAKFGNDAPEHLSQIIIGERDIGETLVTDTRIPVISATGSTAMGRSVGPKVAQRFGRSILELGGNNAIIVTPSADLDLAFQAILFGAVGTCGQRCTTTRRLFLHEDIYDSLVPRLKNAYEGLAIGNPLDEKTLIGPLIDEQAFENMQTALKKAQTQEQEQERDAPTGSTDVPIIKPTDMPTPTPTDPTISVLTDTTIANEENAFHTTTITGGVRIMKNKYPEAYYVTPAIIEMQGKTDNIKEETFAPILYIFKYKNINDAIARHNDVPQGLSSAIFTNDIREAELFTSETGSDCGIVNVNIGTSGAEIGGAFGGEKETGGGRESGSDSWKSYMRRMTSTINYSADLPLAQGVTFGKKDK